MAVDPFSDVLTLSKAEAVVTGGFTAGGPWSIRFPAREKIKFFAVVKGSCWVHLEGAREPLLFETGDVGLLAKPRVAVLSSDPGLEPVDAMSLFSNVGRNAVAVVGDGGDFGYIGGHVMLDPIRGKLLADILPPWILTRAASPHAAAFRWLLDRLIEERTSGRPGSQLASSQLTQLLFIEILRSHLGTARLMPAGWLRALAEPRIAPALRLMHGDPARSWHLEELAKACAMSRTSFAFHFRTVAGVAPLTYLATWRMHLAERSLRDERTAVATVARSLGYTSESAFSNAFKRANGKSPSAYRASVSGLDKTVPEQTNNAAPASETAF
ncbi:AraC family transcriptional regulator [Rhizobium sp. OAE497]|jgi:AraC-like DNA-binding protein|uniref:AraC family transcriptional regulator n=1 Tax=Rhizobium sp. OAE497 TaxID=2663796 RepID=UPI0010E372AC